VTETAKPARCLGLLGGLGPGATVHYYRVLLAAHAAANRVPQMLIAHADVDRVRQLVEQKDLTGLARYLAGFIASMKAGGAEMTAIVAITPHICAAELTAISPLPLIDMVSVVGDDIRARGLKRVALLGTRFTVESRMFGRLPCDVVMPKPDEIDTIHNTYLDVLYDRSTPAQIDRLRDLARILVKRDGAEALLLAGTDLSMVMDEKSSGFPAIDCAALHIRTITQKLIA
jgi:aspartate racemase